MARQIPLPLAAASAPGRIVVGNANAAVLDALAQPAHWPYRTALLAGPPRAGKSLLGRWFAGSGAGEVLDDAEQLDETVLFHRWNRAQESGTPLLLVVNAPAGGWMIRLPDLASRLGAALHLEIAAPDDAMLAELLALHAEQRGFALGSDAAAYLVPRLERSHLAVERVVEAIDRLSLERKQPPTLSVWREALEEIKGAGQPGLPE
ncbi:MAG: ATPase [Sphingomonadales bacterium]|nr:ATPase [Sphingomonadales bacterium]